MKPVRVGVGTMILKDGKILLGKRHKDPEKADSELHGEGTWTMPGGKVDFHDELKDAARREVEEETGLLVKGLELISVTNDKVTDSHFVTLGFLAREWTGEVEVREPDEITQWAWFHLDRLPEKMFPPSEKIVRNYLDKEIMKH